MAPRRVESEICISRLLRGMTPAFDTETFTRKSHEPRFEMLRVGQKLAVTRFVV